MSATDERLDIDKLAEIAGVPDDKHRAIIQRIAERLREIGPYEALSQEIGVLVEQKNRAYGSSFSKSGDFLRLLYPDGLRPEQYGDALLLVRIFDKCMRIAHEPDAFGESPYKDISGYGLLGAVQHERAREAAKEEPTREGGA